MIPQYDIDYSLAREIVERRASLESPSACARMVHAVLADRYALRARGPHGARCEASLKC